MQSIYNPAYSSYSPQYAPAQLSAYSDYVSSAPIQLDQSLLTEIESRVQSLLPGQKRVPVCRREVCRVQGQPGRVCQVVRRLPTPPPDIIDRVIQSKPQNDVINLRIERPCTPPPCIRERRESEVPARPVINQQIVRVPPRNLNPCAALANYQCVPTPQTIPLPQAYSVCNQSYASNQPVYQQYAAYQPGYQQYAAYQPGYQQYAAYIPGYQQNAAYQPGYQQYAAYQPVYTSHQKYAAYQAAGAYPNPI